MLRISSQAQTLIEHLKDIDWTDFEKWFLEESEQTVIGSQTITAYFLSKKKKK